MRWRSIVDPLASVCLGNLGDDALLWSTSLANRFLQSPLLTIFQILRDLVVSDAEKIEL